MFRRIVFKNKATSIQKHRYFNRSERSTQIAYISKRVVCLNIAKPVNKHSGILTEVSVVHGFSMFRRVVFKNIAKPLKQNTGIFRCVRNTRICNASEAVASKPLKTHMYFCVLLNALRIKRFGASGGSKQHNNKNTNIQNAQNTIHAFRPGMQISCQQQKHTKTCKNIGISGEVSVVQGFSMFRRVAFNNIAKPIKKTQVF